jgi:hypothetical protein
MGHIIFWLTLMGDSEYFWGFCVPWKGHKEQGQGDVGGTFR